MSTAEQQRTGVRGRPAHKMGQFYRNMEGRVFILAQVSKNMMTLVSLMDGNRWHDPVKVENPSRLSPQEWDYICDEEKFSRQ